MLANNFKILKTGLLIFCFIILPDGFDYPHLIMFVYILLVCFLKI